MLFACEPNTGEQFTNAPIDTIMFRFGNAHQTGPFDPGMGIQLTDSKSKETIRRFFSDSTYKITIEGARIKVAPASSNIVIEEHDSIFIVTTPELGNDSTFAEISFFFVTDTTKNIIMYHYKSTNHDDPNIIEDTIERFQGDTIGTFHYFVEPNPNK